jgi:hypothetical protein
MAPFFTILHAGEGGLSSNNKHTGKNPIALFALRAVK